MKYKQKLIYNKNSKVRFSSTGFKVRTFIVGRYERGYLKIHERNLDGYAWLLTESEVSLYFEIQKWKKIIVDFKFHSRYNKLTKQGVFMFELYVIFMIQFVAFIVLVTTCELQD